MVKVVVVVVVVVVVKCSLMRTVFGAAEAGDCRHCRMPPSDPFLFPSLFWVLPKPTPPTPPPKLAPPSFPVRPSAAQLDAFWRAWQARIGSLPDGWHMSWPP